MGGGRLLRGRPGVHILAAALLAGVLAMLGPGMAQAHKLRVFAALSDGEIAGYAFFVGGGRPQDVPVSIANAAGTIVSESRTDGEGAFRWKVTAPDDYTVTVNAQDGHAASARVAAGGAASLPAPADAAVVADPAAPSPAPDVAVVEAAISAAVSAAVQREIMPLREEIAAMDNRLRLVDVISGVFLLVGLAGIVLWLMKGRARG